MDGDEIPSFASAEDEVKYWKNMAGQYRKGMLDAREELDEFQVWYYRYLNKLSFIYWYKSLTLVE